MHLHIGPHNPPTHLTTPQSRLTAASAVLHRHLRAQVPDPADYRGRDKTMKMRNEAPATVERFLKFVERGSYVAGPPHDAVREHLRLLVFADKYDVPALAYHARRKAAQLLQHAIAAAEHDDGGGGGGEKAWAKICAQVLAGVEPDEKSVLRDVLGRLATPFVWQASGDW